MTKFCPECGTQQHEDNAKFCANCGFDFSKIENKDKVQTRFLNAIKNEIESSDVSSSNQCGKANDSKKSQSSSQIKKTTNSGGILSNLTFNKCFLAFAVLLIFMTIMGMIIQASETQPSSDHGLTSFMESSSSYDMDSFIEDSNHYDDSDYYYNDSDSNYLSYGVLSVHSMADFLYDL